MVFAQPQVLLQLMEVVNHLEEVRHLAQEAEVKYLVQEVEVNHLVQEVKVKHQDPAVDYQRCAELISEAFSYMIFDRGFLHCDPHAGNIIVRQTGDDLKIVLLDHGLYSELSEGIRLSYTKLWCGILTQNEDVIKEASREIPLRTKLTQCLIQFLKNKLLSRVDQSLLSLLIKSSIMMINSDSI
jgi:hypothetical protein